MERLRPFAAAVLCLLFKARLAAGRHMQLGVLGMLSAPTFSR